MYFWALYFHCFANIVKYRVLCIEYYVLRMVQPCFNVNMLIMIYN